MEDVIEGEATEEVVRHDGSSRAMAVREQPAELSVDELVAQVEKIQQAQQAAMKDGEHYGVIPGTNKPTLLKPGAEKLCLLFRLDPEYEEHERFDPDGHYYVRVKCTLFHIPTGNRVASGLGSCTTRETKYAYRTASRTCPSCGSDAIIKGKQEYGGGWLCFKKKGGCGAKFKDGDQAIESQEAGQVENENIANTYNTVLKMASKRALIAAVLNGTAASDLFTQDLEDNPPDPQPKVEQPPRGSTEKPKVLTVEEALAELRQRQSRLVRIDPANWKKDVIFAIVAKATNKEIKDWEDLPKEWVGSLLRTARHQASGIEENLQIDPNEKLDELPEVDPEAENIPFGDDPEAADAAAPVTDYE